MASQIIISFPISADLKNRLEDFATSDRRSRSEVIRWALEEFLPPTPSKKIDRRQTKLL